MSEKRAYYFLWRDTWACKKETRTHTKTKNLMQRFIIKSKQSILSG